MRGLAVSRDALTVDRAVCAAERRSVRPLAAVCDFADGSRHASPWAARIYNDAIARGKDHLHAVRILARA